MKTELAKKLKEHYYSRQGNKVLFGGRFTLNQLATEMCARPGGTAIDPSVLSRIINGTRLFTPAQLEVFCVVMGFTAEEQGELELALTQDLYRKHDFRSDPAQSLYLEFFDRDLELIQRVIARGDPYLALALSDTTTARLESLIQAATNPRNRQALVKRLGLLLFEKGRVLRETLPLTDILTATLNITSKMKAIAEEYDDDELHGLIGFSLGDAYYIVGDYVASINYLTVASETVRDIDYKLWALRELLLDWAYLEKKHQFQEVVEQALALIKAKQYTRLDLVCAVHEGVARGECKLGMPEQAYRSLDLARTCLGDLEAQGEKAPLRFIQIIRTEIELIRTFESTVNSDIEIKMPVEGALHTARERGYLRHAGYIQSLLQHFP